MDEGLDGVNKILFGYFTIPIPIPCPGLDGVNRILFGYASYENSRSGCVGGGYCDIIKKN